MRFWIIYVYVDKESSKYFLVRVCELIINNSQVLTKKYKHKYKYYSEKPIQAYSDFSVFTGWGTNLLIHMVTNYQKHILNLGW